MFSNPILDQRATHDISANAEYADIHAVEHLVSVLSIQRYLNHALVIIQDEDLRPHRPNQGCDVRTEETKHPVGAGEAGKVVGNSISQVN